MEAEAIEAGCRDRCGKFVSSGGGAAPHFLRVLRAGGKEQLLERHESARDAFPGFVREVAFWRTGRRV